MKKLLVLLVTLTLVIVLSGCASTPQGDFVTVDKYNELELRLEALQKEFDNQTVMGFSYENKEGLQLDLFEQNGLTLSTDKFDISSTDDEDYMVVGQYPDYVYDLVGGYIDSKELSNLLTQKYLGVSAESFIGSQYSFFTNRSSEMTDTELIVRVSMMIEELSHYDFYTYDVNTLYIKFNEGGSQTVTVRMKLLVEDKYTLHPALIWNELLETDVKGLVYNSTDCELLYATYLEEATFDGYVLPNYIE